MKKYVKSAVTSLLDEDISVQEELARSIVNNIILGRLSA